MTTHIMILRPSFPLLIGLLCISIVGVTYAAPNKVTVQSQKASASESAPLYTSSQPDPNQQASYSQLAENDDDALSDATSDEQQEVDSQPDKSNMQYFNYGPSNSKVSISYGPPQATPQSQLQPYQQQQAGSSNFVRLAKITEVVNPIGYEHSGTNNLNDGHDVYESGNQGSHPEPNGGNYEETYGGVPAKGATVTVYSADGVSVAGGADVSHPEPYQNNQNDDLGDQNEQDGYGNVPATDDDYKMAYDGGHQIAPIGYGYLPTMAHHYHPHHRQRYVGHKVKTGSTFEHFVDTLLKTMPSVQLPSTDKTKVLVDLAHLLGSIKMPHLEATVNVPTLETLENLVKQGDKSGLSFKLPDILSMFSIDFGDSGKKKNFPFSIGSPQEFMKSLPGLSMNGHSSHSDKQYKPVAVSSHHGQTHAVKHSPLSFGSHHGPSVDLIKNLPMGQGISLDGELGKFVKNLPFTIGSPLDLMKNLHIPSFSMGGDSGKSLKNLQLPEIDGNKLMKNLPFSMGEDSGKKFKNLQFPEIDGNKLMKNLQFSMGGDSGKSLKNLQLPGIDGNKLMKNLPFSMGEDSGKSLKNLQLPGIDGNKLMKNLPFSMGEDSGKSLKNLQFPEIDGDKLMKNLPFSMGEDSGNKFKNLQLPGIDGNKLMKNLPFSMGEDSGKSLKNLQFPEIDGNKLMKNLQFSMGGGDAGKMLKKLPLPEIDGDKLMKNLPFALGSSSDLIKQFQMPDFSLDGKSADKGQPLSLGSHHGTSVNLIKSLAFPLDLHSTKGVKFEDGGVSQMAMGLLKNFPKVSMPKFKLSDLKFLDGLSDLIKLPKFETTKKEKVEIKHVQHHAPVQHVQRIPVYYQQNPPQYVAHHHQHHAHHHQETPKKYVMAFPLHKGNLHGHVVIEDYPYGRSQNGPYDELEAEIGCAELDPMLHPHGHGSNPVKFAVAAKQY